MNVNLYCPINQLGYGIVSTNIFKELIKENAVSLWPIGPIDCNDEVVDSIKNAIFSSSFFDSKAPSLKIWHQWDMAINPGKGKHCGLTFFEIDPISKSDVHSLNSLDCVFVTSEWAKNVCIKSGVNPLILKVINLGIDKDIFKDVNVIDNGPTKFVNIGKWEVRKGHDIIPQILEESFTPEDNFEFHIYPNNPFLNDKESLEWESFYKSSKLANKIFIHKERYRTQQELYENIKNYDVGIFPYRAEAWNMELMELLSIGKNCIATNYSGPSDFAKKMGCTLIDVDGMEKAYDGKWFYGASSWAKLSSKFISTFSATMKIFHEKKQSGKLHINTIGQQESNNFSWKNTCINLLKEMS